MPDEQAERNHFEIAIPALGSMYLTHRLDGVVKGLKDCAARATGRRSRSVFFAFRIMVGIGVLMLA